MSAIITPMRTAAALASTSRRQSLASRTKAALIPLIVAPLVACNEPLPNREAFVLAWVDHSQRIRVATSQDGLSWNRIAQEFGVTNGGVSVASSGDQVGAASVLAHSGTDRVLRLRFAVGDVWESQEEHYDDVLPSGKPVIATLGDNRYVIAFRGGGQRVFVARFDHQTRQFETITPENLSGLDNSNVVGDPAVGYLPDGRRLLIAWVRRAPGQNPEVISVVGTVDTNERVSWVSARRWPQEESGFGAIEFGPSIATQRIPPQSEGFTLGVIRRFAAGQPSSTTPRALVMHSSSDGLAWSSTPTTHSAADSRSIPLGASVAFSFGRGVCTTISAFADGSDFPLMIRGKGSQIRALDNQAVFGSELPDNTPFTLIVKGTLGAAGLGSCNENP